MTCNIVTIFPDLLSHFLSETIIARAIQKNLISVNIIDIRNYTNDKHRTVDDSPYGGGAGMVMKVEPIYNALLDNHIINTTGVRNTLHHVAVLAAGGTPFTQRKAEQYATSKKTITLICGRYEGIDQRVADHLADEEVSIGPYVLSGGEVPAMVILESVSRLIPGVLGNPNSLKEESFVPEIGKEYPQYTKPETFLTWSVPEVLLSGNHERIQEWRRSRGKKVKKV